MYLAILIWALCGFGLIVFSGEFMSPREKYIKFILGGPICWAWVVFLWLLKKLIIKLTGG